MKRKPKKTDQEKEAARRESIGAVKVRMANYSNDFLKTIYYNPSSSTWFQAAKEMLNERKVPKDKPPTPKPHYTRTTITGKDTHINTFSTKSLKVLAEKSTSPTMAEEARKILKLRDTP